MFQVGPDSLLSLNMSQAADFLSSSWPMGRGDGDLSAAFCILERFCKVMGRSGL